MKIAVLLLVLLAPIQEPTSRPPSITYGSTRESKAWITKPDGTAVAVDDGITWKGVTVYLSLTGDLIAIDDKTKKTLWAHDVGAFWNRLTFVEISRAGGKSWAVQLRPGLDEPEGKDLVQLHDMGSGEIMMRAEDKPAGAKIETVLAGSGSHSRIAGGFAAVVSTPENWDQLRDRLLKGADGADIGKHHKPDFSKEIVLVVSDGETWNCRGLRAESVWRDDKRILVRLLHETYMTKGEGHRERPYGIFRLPRKEGEAVHVERNVQPYVGGPPIWKEAWKLERPKDPAKELDSVPKPDALKND
jgi:hypothetical protein